MYTYLLLRVYNYIAFTNKALLNYFNLQVKNYSIKDY